MICPNCSINGNHAPLRVVRSAITSDGSGERIRDGYCKLCGEIFVYGVETEIIINDCEIITIEKEKLITGVPV